jgi:diguanylate cyclase (GGDEF)-like protein
MTNKPKFEANQSARAHISGLKEGVNSFDNKIIETCNLTAVHDVRVADLRLRTLASENSRRAADTALDLLNDLLENATCVIAEKESAFKILTDSHISDCNEIARQQTLISTLERIVQTSADSLRKAREALRAVTKLAFHDLLTGLPNRRLLEDRLAQVIKNNKRFKRFGGLVFIDLDKFKLLNDVYGHIVGDQLLIATAKRLNASIRDTDTVARFGGDEFILLLSNIGNTEEEALKNINAISGKILSQLCLPYELLVTDEQGKKQTIEYYCLASLGISVFGHTLTDERIIKQADEAMYVAKKNGGNTFYIHPQEAL